MNKLIITKNMKYYFNGVEFQKVKYSINNNILRFTGLRKEHRFSKKYLHVAIEASNFVIIDENFDNR